tara:strand:- start:943 stop:1245 length:303 start_codon:yes stop_codon:yes gene_type:complete
MTFPKISDACLLATLTKATQRPQDEFAAEFMTQLTIEQPETMQMIVAMLEPFLKPQPDIETVSLAQAQDVILQSTMSILGIVLQSIAAQQEADEMNEAWG